MKRALMNWVGAIMIASMAVGPLTRAYALSSGYEPSTSDGVCREGVTIEYVSASTNANKCGFDTYQLTSPPKRYRVETITQSASTFTWNASFTSPILDAGPAKRSACPGAVDFTVDVSWTPTTNTGSVSVKAWYGYGYTPSFSDSVSRNESPISYSGGTNWIPEDQGFYVTAGSGGSGSGNYGVVFTPISSLGSQTRTTNCGTLQVTGTLTNILGLTQWQTNSTVEKVFLTPSGSSFTDGERKYTLSSEYTTGEMESDSLSGLNGLDSTSWSTSAKLASRNLPTNETSIALGKMRTRMTFSSVANREYILFWEEVTCLDSKATISVNRKSRPVTGRLGTTTVTNDWIMPPSQNGTISVVRAWVEPALSCTSCDDGSAGPGTGMAKLDGNGVDVGMSLGQAGFGEAAGGLQFGGLDAGAYLASPASLNFRGNSNYSEVIRASGVVRQVRSPQCLADVVTGTNGYEVRFYSQSGIGTQDGNGHYQTTGSPYAVWSVQNLDGTTNSCNDLRVVETRGTASYTNAYHWDAGNSTWDLLSGNGLRRDWNQKLWDSTNGIQTETRTTTDPASGATVSKEILKRKQFAWGLGLTERMIDPNGDSLQILYTYNTNGLMTNMVRNDGYWEKYAYDSSNRLDEIHRPLIVNSTNAGWDDTYYQYANSTSFPPGHDNSEPFTPRWTWTSIGISGASANNGYIWLTISNGTRWEIQTQAGSAFWYDTNNLVTFRRYLTNGPFTGRLIAVDLPDGTRESYTYSTNASQLTTVVLKGERDPANETNVLSGTKIVTVTGEVGEIISRHTYFFSPATAPLLTGQETYVYADDLKRSYTVTYLNGTSRTVQYACCGLDLVEEPDGTVTQFLHDGLKRVVNVQNLSLGTGVSNRYDSLGRLVQTIRLGTGGTSATISSASFDGRGRISNETNSLGGPTLHGYWFDGLGRSVHGVTNADAGTSVSTQNIDGRPAEIGGSSEFPVKNSWRVAGGFTVRKTKLASDGSTSEWEDFYSDALGRIKQTGYPDTSGSYNYFNSIGKIWKHRAIGTIYTLYAYNKRAELEYVARDIDRSDTINFNGNDPITRYATEATTNAVGQVVWRSQVFVWGTNSSAVSNLVSTVDVSADGLKRWEIQWGDNSGLTNYTEIAYNSGAGTVTTTAVAPDGSYNISVRTYGRLTSVASYASNGTPLGQQTYAYDNFGRVQSVTDTRTGTTSYSYNNADQVTSVTVPAPGGSQTTQYQYDLMGRKVVVIQPDGATITNSYAQTGLLTNMVGSRITPVSYTYDAQGRVKTMTTWTNSAQGLGAATTTWSYHAQRGWLQDKLYADGLGLSYTNDAGGRLTELVFARKENPSAPTKRVRIHFDYDTLGRLDGSFHYDAAVYMVRYLGYDRRGRLFGFTNGIWNTGPKTYYSYNNLDQLTGETYVQGPQGGLSVTNIFDAFGRRITNGVLNGSTWVTTSTYTYDEASRLKTAGLPEANVNVTYGYVAGTPAPLASQLLFQQGGNTRLTTTKTYDNLDRLTAVSSAPSAQPQVPSSYSYLYNDANQRTRNTQVDGSYWRYEYDDRGQVISGKRYWNDGTPVAGQQFEYGFDDLGNRTFANAGGDASGANLRAAGYSANALNQYTSRDVPGAVDVTGVAIATNTVTVDGVAAYRKGEYFWREVPVTNASSAAWQGITVSSGGSNVTGNVFLPQTPEAFGYDADGNLTNDGRWTFKWDGDNRLVLMTANTNTPSASRKSLKFDYDWQGRRISKVVSNWTGSAWTIGVSNKFVYDGWNLVAELNGTNGLVRSYLWGSDLSGGDAAGGVGGLLAVRVHGAGTNFVALDGNGNVSALVDATDGTVKASYDYGPFGELVRADGLMARANPFRFSTKYQDDESDFLYYGYRYLANGRWLNRDPIEESGGLNLYAFVGNDGVNQVDGLGMYSSLNFVPAAELAWMLGTGAALDAGLSIGTQRLLRDPCDENWLDWGEVGKDVGVGAALNVATLGIYKGVQAYKGAKLAKAIEEAAELAAKGQYDDVAELVAKYGDDFEGALYNYKKAKAAAQSPLLHPGGASALNNGADMANAAGKAAGSEINFGKHLRKLKGEPPAGMIDPHAHHIVFKEGLGEAQKALVQEGHSLMRRYGIDPIMGGENLVWAPMRVKGQHGINALQNAVDQLKAVEAAGGSRADIVEMLDELGKLAAQRR